MRLEAVGKRYGVREPWVVRGVSADLPAGRLVRVAGRNGSGKSTLLRVVAGVSRPSAGSITGRPHTGYVPERFPGGLPFTGREYLLHLARVHGLRGEAGRRRVAHWLDRLGAAGYADQSLGSMSKGMCQKMAVAQALLPSPGLLVLDEAWTGLDQAARGELDIAVTERVAAGGTVLFVDHDPARLAGREDERWNFDGAGRVTVLAGPAPRADPASQASPVTQAAPAAQAGPRTETITVRLETADAASVLDQVRAIDGVRVLSAEVERGPGTEGAGAERSGAAGHRTAGHRTEEPGTEEPGAEEPGAAPS
jgi:ABC-type Mn2+/Zn2+ transport system ATPase subunit